MNPNAYSVALRAVRQQIDRLEAVTDNLANASTPGYRRVQTGDRPFDEVYRHQMASSRRPPSLPAVSTVKVDFSAGAHRQTDRPLDFALTGPGFFSVENEGTTYYTRNGQFQLTPDGALVTVQGFAVQGTGGPIQLPTTIDMNTVTVSADGVIRSDTQELATLQLSEFEDTAPLIKAGQTLFLAPDSVTPTAAEQTRVTNRALEASNTSVFGEMAELLSCVRSFESCQKIIKYMDQTEGQTVKYLS